MPTAKQTVVRKLIRFAGKSPSQQLLSIRWHLKESDWYWDWYWKVHDPGKDRTTYITGLGGTGRRYIEQVMLQNIGERAKYLRTNDQIRFHPGPSSLIFSGHATVKYVSRNQAPPAVTNRILEAVRSGFGDLIFVYRHPIDSWLTNWVFWRAYIREKRFVADNQPGTRPKSTEIISAQYQNIDDLCAELERNFAEFESFVHADPSFYAAMPGLRFLSFAEFIEETELFLQRAPLSLQLEDFMADPQKEFSKIAEVMSVDLDLSRLIVARPSTKPYRYLAVKERAPRFRNFVNGLNTDTKKRIENMGYSV
jgi:hypothetical protein